MNWQPQMITGMIRDTLIQHFADPMSVADGDLRQLVWRDDERTGILIESIYMWKGQLVEKRPAVLIKRNNAQVVRMGTGDLRGYDQQGRANHTHFIVGSHTVFSLHGSAAGAEILGSEVMAHLSGFQLVFMEKLRLNNWQVTEWGAPQEIEEAKETFAVPVTVAWVYARNWTVAPEALKLKAIDLRNLLGEALVM